MSKRNRFQRDEFNYEIESKLISCPFCGNKNLEVRREWFDDFHSHMWILCPQCGIKSKRVFSSKEGRKELISLWNNRASFTEYPLKAEIKCIFFSFFIRTFDKLNKVSKNIRNKLINFVKGR